MTAIRDPARWTCSTFPPTITLIPEAVTTAAARAPWAPRALVAGLIAGLVALAVAALAYAVLKG